MNDHNSIIRNNINGAGRDDLPLWCHRPAWPGDLL